MKSLNNFLPVVALLLLGFTQSGFAAGPKFGFSEMDWLLWEEQVFAEKTNYVTVREGDDWVLHARCRHSASGWLQEVDVDLKKTPWVTWRWWVSGTYSEGDGHQREREDMAARVYFVSGGRLLPWRAKALNYVWANRQPKGSAWISPYLSQQRIIAVQSGDELAGQWQQESRNLVEDYQRLFDADVDRINAIGLMSDCDNLKGEGEAKYSTFRFSANP